MLEYFILALDNNSSYQKSIPASQTKIKKPFKSAGGRPDEKTRNFHEF